MFFLFELYSILNKIFNKDLEEVREGYMSQLSLGKKAVGYYDSTLEVWENGVMTLSTSFVSMREVFDVASMFNCTIVNLNKAGLEGLVKEAV
jgi:hypothetical protein